MPGILNLTLRLDESDESPELQVVRMNGREAISELFWFELDVVASAGNALPEELGAGQSASLRFVRDDDEVRAVHGILERVDLVIDATTERPTHRVRLVPRAWRSTLIKTQQILMDLSELDVVRNKLSLVGLDDEDVFLHVLHEPPKREFIVQYGETDIQFVTRLCEHLGISFYFDHTSGSDRVVFTDNADGFLNDLLKSVEMSVRLDEPGRIYRLVRQSRMVPAMCVVYDYNYRAPDVPLKATERVEDGHGGGILEYGAHVKTPADGERLAAIRAEEQRCRAEKYRGEGTVCELTAGLTTTVESQGDAPDVPLLIIVVEHHAEPGSSGTALSYRSTFEGVSGALTYRPERKTPKPRIHGVVTAVVQGAESDTGRYARIDDQGRYTVQFHFDGALGALNEKASRPVRMAQPLAGASEGMHFPLKPGVEVAIAFSNGDPDRPIILGALPNHTRQSVVTEAEAQVNRIQTNDGITIQFGKSN